MPKTEFLQIRLSPEDRERLRTIAQADHLDMSTWARRVILQALDKWESKRTRTGTTKRPD
jgi:predicted transcriptional regulator